MHVLITCKNEENSIKNEGTGVATTYLPFYVDFSKCSRAANSAVGSWIWLKFKLCQEFMIVLVTCKNEEDPIKMKVLEWPQGYMSIFQMFKGR